MKGNMLLLLLVALLSSSKGEVCGEKECIGDEICMDLHKVLDVVRLCVSPHQALLVDTNQCRNGGFLMPCYSLSGDCNVADECVCPGNYIGPRCEYAFCMSNFGGVCGNGICHPTHGCLCLPGYHGDRCEYKLCNSAVRCVHGTCEEGCKCFPGYSGTSCDEVPCNGLTCLNGGYCHLGTCICMAGFYGQNCETKICPNSLQPCSKGDCVKNGICKCYRGFSGKFCNFKECSGKQCSQFSTCKTDAKLMENESMCSCTSRFSGTSCEIEPIRCGSSNFRPYYCQNGGSCHPYFKNCVCPNEYEGDSCELQKTKCGGKRLCSSGEFCVNGECCSVKKAKLCKPALQDAKHVSSIAKNSLPWYFIFMICMMALACISTFLAYKATEPTVVVRTVVTHDGEVKSVNELSTSLYSTQNHPLNVAGSRSIHANKSRSQQSMIRSELRIDNRSKHQTVGSTTSAIDSLQYKDPYSDIVVKASSKKFMTPSDTKSGGPDLLSVKTSKSKRSKAASRTSTGKVPSIITTVVLDDQSKKSNTSSKMSSVKYKIKKRGFMK